MPPVASPLVAVASSSRRLFDWRAWQAWKHPFEFAMLLGLFISLAAFEAPKNYFWIAYVATWFINRAFLDRHESGASSSRPESPCLSTHQ